MNGINGTNHRHLRGPRSDMVPEITAAVSFVSGLLRTRGCVSEQQLQVFGGALREALTGPGVPSRVPQHYRHHWFPEKPSKGSGYRCLRISHGLDPLIGRAAGRVGLSLARLLQLLPRELTLWVDPFEVCYRIGDHGSICVLYQASKPSPPSSYPGPLTCKNHMMLAPSASPSKNCILAVSS